MSNYDELNMFLDKADRVAGRPTHSEEKEARKQRFLRVLNGNATEEDKKMLSTQEGEVIGAIRGYRDGTLQRKLEEAKALLESFKVDNQDLDARDPQLVDLQNRVRWANGNLHRGETYSERVDKIGDWSDLD